MDIDWIELFKDTSILIATWVAILGVNSWRKEHRGRREIELAEETLALFYEAADAISHIRSPLSDSSETADLTQRDNESDDDFVARKEASIVFKRYSEHQELFNRLHSMRYRFMAQIGKKQAAPFESLREIVVEVKTSARMLAKLWAHPDRATSDEAAQRYKRDVESCEAVFWEGSSDEDPITPKLRDVVSQIEGTCQRVMAGRNTFCTMLWRKLEILRHRSI